MSGDGLDPLTGALGPILRLGRRSLSRLRAVSRSLSRILVREGEDFCPKVCITEHCLRKT